MAKPDYLRLVPGTHVVEEENVILKFFSDRHMCTVAYAHPHTDKQYIIRLEMLKTKTN